MQQALIATIAFSFCYSLQIVFQQLFIRSSLQPLHLNFLSYLVSFVLMSLYFLIFNRKIFFIKFNIKTSMFFLIATVLWLSSDLLTVNGLKTSSSTNLSILSRLQIFISFFGAYLFLKEKITSNKLISVIISMIGGIIIVYNFKSGLKINHGDLLFLMAIFTISISGLFRQKITETISSLQLTYLMFGFAALFLGLIILFFSPIKVFPPTGFIIFNAIIGLVGFNLVNYAIFKGGAAFFSIVSNALPVFTIIFSFIIFKYLPVATQIIGGLLIVFSIFLFQKKQK